MSTVTPERPSPAASSARRGSSLPPEVHARVQRLTLSAAVVSLAMLVVGLFLAALGILVLRVAGGAAHDTSLVVLVAAYGVTDMWGASIVAARSGAPERTVTAAWCVMHATWLIILTVVAPKLWPVALAMLVIAAPLAYIGARVARHQMALRRSTVL